MAVLAGCGRGAGRSSGDSGSIHASLAFSPSDGVSGVEIDVRQGATLVVSKTIPIPSGTPDGGPAADAFFVLPAGTYAVTATALGADGKPAQKCMTATTTATVAVGLTTEVTLSLFCGGGGNGGLDVVVTAEHAPTITNLTFDPNKFVTVCEPVTITVTATSPDGLPLKYDWTVASTPGTDVGASPSAGVAPAAPAGGPPLLTPAADHAVVFSSTAGDFSFTVTVTDPNGHSSSLTFPVHVLAGNGCAPTPRAGFASDVTNLFGLTPATDTPAFSDVGPKDPLFATVQSVAPFLNRQLLCFGCALGSNFLPGVASSRGQDAVLVTSILVARGLLAPLSAADADSVLAGFADGASIPPPARSLVATALDQRVLTPLPGALVATGMLDTNANSDAMLARAAQIQMGGAP